MDMALETYRKIADDFPLAQNVYLSGWGEPLLNPHLKEMVRLAKKAGCTVGFTTNGALLDENMMRDLVKDQVDLVSVSIAGATMESHGSKRVGSDFKKITEKLARLHSVKVESGSEKPRVLILFMMLKDNLHELSSAVMLAADVEADGIVATNLDYVGHPVQDELKAFSSECTPADNRAKIWEAQELAEELGIHIDVFPVEMSPVQICSEDPLHNLYVSENGDVSPCVYLNLPLDQIPRMFCNMKTLVSPMIYGNIEENNILEIWENRDYVSFRDRFEKRKIDANLAPLPDPCKTCYKAYGI